jgi:ATP-binding cassette, subfamily A (ABC1), member 3
VTSASIFGAAFFQRSQLASIVVSIISFLLAVVAAVQENLTAPPPLSQVMVLSFFFPSANYVYFFNFITKAEIAEVPLNMQQPLPSGKLGASIPGQARGVNWVTLTGPYVLWIFLIIQIFGYGLLAVFVESYRHGNNRKRRTFNSNPDDQRVAIKTSGLIKHYTPSVARKIFCCFSSHKTVKAVDGLDLVSQRNQILCLLGPNGSGKTTTLDMLAGFQTPTDGSVNINAPASQLGALTHTS